MLKFENGGGSNLWIDVLIAKRGHENDPKVQKTNLIFFQEETQIKSSCQEVSDQKERIEG